MHYKVSKSMVYWFTQVVELLLRIRRFMVHMGNKYGSWK